MSDEKQSEAQAMTFEALPKLQRLPGGEMQPGEWLYWAFADAGMDREAEGMLWALMSFKGAMADQVWQYNRRKHEADKVCKLLAAIEQALPFTTPEGSKILMRAVSEVERKD